MALPSIFEYLPEYAEVIYKIAAEEQPPQRKGERKGVSKLHIPGLIGTGVLGMGTGMAAGTGLGFLADHLYQRAYGTPLPIAPQHAAVAGSLLGSGLGLAYGLWKAKEQEALQRVVESDLDPPAGRVSPK